MCAYLYVSVYVCRCGCVWVWVCICCENQFSHMQATGTAGSFSQRAIPIRRSFQMLLIFTIKKYLDSTSRV